MGFQSTRAPRVSMPLLAMSQDDRAGIMTKRSERVKGKKSSVYFCVVLVIITADFMVIYRSVKRMMFAR